MPGSDHSSARDRRRIVPDYRTVRTQNNFVILSEPSELLRPDVRRNNNFRRESKDLRFVLYERIWVPNLVVRLSNNNVGVPRSGTAVEATGFSPWNNQPEKPWASAPDALQAGATFRSHTDEFCH